MRDDVGALWENFIYMESVKYASYRAVVANRYFWRTYEQQEIDLVEEEGGGLHGFELKWSPRKKVPIPKLWQAAYPDADFRVITPDNYLDFVCGT